MKGTGRKPGAIALVRKDVGMPQSDLAERASLSVEHIFRIEKGKSEPSLGATWRICQALDISLHDMLNLTALAGELGPFIRLPYVIRADGLVEQVEKFNSDEMQRRYFQADRFEDRVKLYLTFREVIASHERQTEVYLKYGRAEYVRVTPEALPVEKGAVQREKLELGEAFEAVRKLRGISAAQIARETEVAQSVISKFENNLSDPAISAYDRVVRSLGLTPDELIYIAYPPRVRWPLFLPYGSYLNRYMAASNADACLNFASLADLRQRAELMMGHKDWLAAERKAKAEAGHQQVMVETPPVFERLKILLQALPSGPSRLKLAN